MIAHDAASLPLPAERRTTFTVGRDLLFMLALLFAFLGQAFPYGVPLFLPCALVAFMLALLCAAWRNGIARVRLGSGPFPLLVTLALVFFLYGLLLTTKWDVSLRSEVFNAIAVLLLWVVAANRDADAQRLHRHVARFMKLLMIVAVLLAWLGLVKFLLFLQGHRLSFVEQAAGGQYPWGTSLTADYNMYALTMTAGGLAALSWLLSARSLPAKLLASGLLLSLLAAGFLSGSRRFWVVAPLMFALLVVSGIRREGSKRALGGVTVLLACVAALVALLYWFVPIDWAKLANTGWDLQYRLATLLDSGQSGGLEARFSRWQFATHMLTDYRVWIGSGFDYLAVYSCHFDDCVVAGYPHNPVISAWLYAGVAGALSVLALLGYFLYCGLQLLRGAMPLLGALLIAHLPFTVISSNGPFAVKSMLVTGLLAALYLGRQPPGPSLPPVANALS